jgi:hypothetical protein
LILFSHNQFNVVVVVVNIVVVVVVVVVVHLSFLTSTRK